MSSQQKRGFRLPWAADRSDEDAAGAATLEADSADPTTPAQIGNGEGGDLGEGPFHFADAATPDASTDASPEAADVPETAAEAGMLNTESAMTDSATSDAADAAATSTTDDDTWAALRRQAAEAADAQPETDDDTFQAVTPDPSASAEEKPEPAAKTGTRGSGKVEAKPPTSRSNPLVAGLVKAMREAALASRAETTTRLQAEASARVEAIRTEATEESAALRKRVDEDIAGIRDWSKGEMARIRQETEAKIEARRAEAVDESEQYTASVEKLVAQVQGRVDAYEADMDSFFERLLAENDPSALAGLAGQAPDAPDLTAEVLDQPEAVETPTTSEWDDVAWGAIDGDILIGASDATTETEAETTSDTEPTGEADTTAEADSSSETEATAEPDTETTAASEPVAEAGLEAEAAAEAEAASTEGLDVSPDGVWPTSVLAAARRTLHTGDADFQAAGVANTRLLVNGLTSVAGISAFKGALGQLPGVRSVSVSSGEPGVFIFTVVHTPETDLQDGIAGLTAFSARVTDADGDSLTVVAQEPAA